MVREFGSFFPELVAARDTIHSVIREEEASFSRTLIKGIERFKKVRIQGAWEEAAGRRWRSREESRWWCADGWGGSRVGERAWEVDGGSHGLRFWHCPEGGWERPC